LAGPHGGPSFSSRETCGGPRGPARRARIDLARRSVGRFWRRSAPLAAEPSQPALERARNTNNWW
jgi:hypothetical protein